MACLDTKTGVSRQKLARRDIPLKEDIAFFVLGFRFAPVLLVVIPLFSFFQTVGLYDTYFGMIWVYQVITLPMIVWLSRSYIEDIPKDIEEAAAMDGAKPFRIVLHVVLSAFEARSDRRLVARLPPCLAQFRPRSDPQFDQGTGHGRSAQVAQSRRAVLPGHGRWARSDHDSSRHSDRHRPTSPRAWPNFRCGEMNVRSLMFFGTTNLDLCFNVDRLPTPGESLIGTLTRNPGGKGANQAVAAARLGLRPRFYTRLGDDDVGRSLLQSLIDAGVCADAIEICPQEVSGSALVMVGDDGSNMIVIDPGANLNVTPEMIESAAEFIERDAIVVVEMGMPIPALNRLFEMKSDKGFELIFNPAPVLPGLSSAAWRSVDFVTPNQTEAFELTGIEVNDFDSAAGAAARLLALGPRAALITLGAQGAYYADAETSFALRAFPVKAIDTTAAGDAFNGAFAASLAQGLPLREAVRQALAVAALCVTRRGAQSAMPSAQAVEEFLMSQTILEME
jgi:ribokinase